MGDGRFLYDIAYVMHATYGEQLGIKEQLFVTCLWMTECRKGNRNQFYEA